MSVAAADEAVLRLDFQGGLAAIWELVGALNGYLSEEAPWKVAKEIDDLGRRRARVATILYTAAEGLRVLAVVLHPFIPRATASLWTALGAEATPRAAGFAVAPGRGALGSAAGRRRHHQGRVAVPAAARRPAVGVSSGPAAPGARNGAPAAAPDAAPRASAKW